MNLQQQRYAVELAVDAPVLAAAVVLNAGNAARLTRRSVADPPSAVWTTIMSAGALGGGSIG